MDPAEAIGVLLGAKVAAKVCAFIGAALVVLGWLRTKHGRAVGRAIVALSDEEFKKQTRSITRGEWHKLRDRVHTLTFEVDRLKRELDDVRGRLADVEEIRSTKYPRGDGEDAR